MKSPFSNGASTAFFTTLIATLVAWVAACSPSPSGGGESPPDGSPTGDRASTDSATPDSATPDSGLRDSTPTESASPTGDGASIDSTAPDSTAPDSTAPDSATPDSGLHDSSLTDSASSDAKADAGGGATDGGVPEASGGGLIEGGAFTAGAFSCAQCPPGTKSIKGVCLDDTQVINGCADPGSSLCAPAHALPTCAAGTGKCAILQCEDGWVDCDGLVSDGCEANLSSLTSCGACGVVCGATQFCSAAGCVNTCPPPLKVVGSSCVDTSNPGDGGGSTTACMSGYTWCGGTAQGDGCFDLANDPLHCGYCYTGCGAFTGGAPSGGGAWACVAGQCEALCPPGAQLCGNACVVEALDPANCGACGHYCTGTDVCRLGNCVTLASTAVVTGVTGGLDLVADAVNLYFVDAAGVHSVPKTGGAVTDIAPATGNPVRVAVDDTYAYWSENLAGSIMRAPKDGSGTPSVVATATTLPQGLVVVGGTVYWVSSSTADDNVYAVPATGGSAGTLTTVTDQGGLGGLQEIRTDGTDLFVAAYLGVFKIAIPGGATSSFYPTGSVFTFLPGAIAARPGQECAFDTGIDTIRCETGGFGLVVGYVLTSDTALTLPECGIVYGRANGSPTGLSATFLVSNVEMDGQNLNGDLGYPQYGLFPYAAVALTNDGPNVYFIDSTGSIRGLPIP
jgi:hypothetical protein